MEANKSVATGLKKRQQIQQANKIVFIWVTIASALVAISVVLLQFMFKEFVFKNAILADKQAANVTLKANLQAYEPLKQEITKLLANADLAKLRVRPEDTALQTVIDAMPTYDDRVAFATSLQQIVLIKSGVTVSVLSVQEGAIGRDGVPLASQNNTSYSASEMQFNVAVDGSYEQLHRVFKDMHNSIRPISVRSVKISGKGDKLNAEVQISTYYASPRSVRLSTGVKQP